MASPVKVSDRLLALAKEEARSTHRSATAQIEHWATLGRAVEAMMTYRDVLVLKRAGDSLPVPLHVSRDDVRAILRSLVENPDREDVKAHIRAAGVPLYGTDPAYPGKLVQVLPDGTVTPGRFEGRRFVADAPPVGTAARKVARRRRR
jgi:hypothetical protein